MVSELRRELILNQMKRGIYGTFSRKSGGTWCLQTSGGGVSSGISYFWTFVIFSWAWDSTFLETSKILGSHMQVLWSVRFSMSSGIDTVLVNFISFHVKILAHLNRRRWERNFLYTIWNVSIIEDRTDSERFLRSTEEFWARLNCIFWCWFTSRCLVFTCKYIRI